MAFFKVKETPQKAVCEGSLSDGGADRHIFIFSKAKGKKPKSIHPHFYSPSWIHPASHLTLLLTIAGEAEASADPSRLANHLLEAALILGLLQSTSPQGKITGLVVCPFFLEIYII